VHDTAVDSFAKNVDLCRGEFARADTALKEEIEFGERSALRLWDTEIRINYAAEADTALYDVSWMMKCENWGGRGQTQKKPV